MDESVLWSTYWDNPSIENRNLLVEFYIGKFRTLAYRKFMSKYHAYLGFTFDDYLNAIAIELIRKIPKYDRSKGYQFASFFALRLNGKLLDMMREHDFVSRGERANGCEAKIMSVECQARYFENYDANTILDVYGPSYTDESDFDFDINDIIRGLNKQEKEIVKLYFVDEMTMANIGKRFNLSESRISQMMTKVVNGLRERGKERIYA